jgi:hypothetical protein
MLVAGLLYWSVKRGMRLTGFDFKELMTNANDDLAIKYFDRLDKGSDKKDDETLKDKKSGDSGYGEPATENA